MRCRSSYRSGIFKILFEADPFTAPGKLANAIKKRTARFVRKEYGDTLLKPYYWKLYFFVAIRNNSIVSTTPT